VMAAFVLLIQVTVNFVTAVKATKKGMKSAKTAFFFHF
jgi:hypothetical protein